MKKGILLCLAAFAAMAALLIAPAFSQEEAAAAKEGDAAKEGAATKEESPQTNELSIYGEVQAVNAASKSMTVQYYDYDSDEEKNIEIAVGEDAKLENAKGINDIKKGDWVDVTYEAAGGKNVAKTVSVEKEEEVPAESGMAPKEAAETAEE
jgi:Cu/Ag efflux protein CusF